MEIDYDNAKNLKNIAERGLSFDLVATIDWGNAIVQEDTRFQYPERRYIAAGKLSGRLHMVCFTPIKGGIRVISFRKANKREVKDYERQTTNR